MRISPKGNININGRFMRPSICQGLPSIGMVSLKFHVAASRLQIPVNSSMRSITVEGVEIGEARNYIAEEYLKMDPLPKYLFFLGDDMLPQWDALIELWKEMETGKWDMLSGLYYLKQEPPEPLLRRRNIPGSLKVGVHYEIGEVIPVDVTGLDFCLIKPEVFHKISKPFFKTGFAEYPDNTVSHTVNGKKSPTKTAIVMHTEDTYFFNQMIEKKMSIGVHTGVRIAHYDHKSGLVY